MRVTEIKWKVWNYGNDETGETRTQIKSEEEWQRWEIRRRRTNERKKKKRNKWKFWSNRNVWING